MDIIKIILAISFVTLSSAGFAEERVNPFKEEFIIPATGVQDCETIDNLKKLYPQWNEIKIWHPKAGKGKSTGNRAQIVSYCDKWSRHGMGGHAGGDSDFRETSSPVRIVEEQEKARKCFTDYDVDGNGRVEEDEAVITYPWTLNKPFGILMWPFSGTFPERTSSVFYGGASGYIKHYENRRGGGGFAEFGINCDHSTKWWDKRAEDHPLNIKPNSKNSKSWVQAYWVMVWKKEDFLNNADKHIITFDDESRLSSICARGYWVGWHDVRMVVQDGEQWYISDNKQFAFPPTSNFGLREDKTRRTGVAFQMNPNKATWTKYYPDSYKLHIDHEHTQYEKHTFKDIQAVGCYIAKDRKTTGEQAHTKWYGFGAEAVINRPEQGSVTIDMAEVEYTQVPPFYMSTCEVPYALYKKIHKWGDVPFHQLDARYVYRSHSDMGSMSYLSGNTKHSQDEPVTNIEWYDALIWCNSLSEYEGKEPAYYMDPEFKNVFRGNHLTTRTKGPKLRNRHKDSPVFNEVIDPKIYLKWSADGFRLPTISEWKAGSGQETTSESLKTQGTIPVGSGASNENGLYDMTGNVWELVWTHGDAYDPAQSTVTALGGGFQQTDTPAQEALSQYGDSPWDGNANIGMRLVRRKSDLAAPQPMTITPESHIKSWTFEKGERTAARDIQKEESLMSMVQIPEGEFLRSSNKIKTKIHSFYASQFETSYEKWQKVFEWAEVNGYEFSKNGDMGSMYYLGHDHEISEPVSEITWWDMLVWCNALSEMEGKTPVFYTDEAKTTVLRKAYIYRPVKMDTKDMFNPIKQPALAQYPGSTLIYTPWYFTRWDADGYRLPTFAEFEYLLMAGQKKPISIGLDYNWTISNASGTTHSVGQKKPNEYGIYDLIGNVEEWTLSDPVKSVYGRMFPARLNVNNPKESKTLAYGIEGNIWEGKKSHLGGSWLWKNTLEYALNSSKCRVSYNYYPDLGFRVVRCDTGTHPEDGIEGMKSSTQIHINKEHFNGLK